MGLIFISVPSLRVRCIYSVVLLMGADEPYEHDAIFITYGNDQPVAVAFKVKDYPVVSYKTGVSIDRLNIRRASPYRTLRVVQGKYAKRYEEGTNVVVIEPDVAKVFPDHDSV